MRLLRLQEFLFSTARGLTSLKCSSAAVLLACVIHLLEPQNFRRASSSLTNLSELLVYYYVAWKRSHDTTKLLAYIFDPSFCPFVSALGKSRDLGGLGASFRSNDEAEQTLNQLLACMDGLDSSKRVCVLAATNRREVLDPALVRPGRFDRIIKVSLPDVKGRERILRVHAKKLPGFTECTGVDDKRPGR